MISQLADNMSNLAVQIDNIKSVATIILLQSFNLHGYYIIISTRLDATSMQQHVAIMIMSVAIPLYRKEHTYLT